MHSEQRGRNEAESACNSQHCPPEQLEESDTHSKSRSIRESSFVLFLSVRPSWLSPNTGPAHHVYSQFNGRVPVCSGLLSTNESPSENHNTDSLDAGKSCYIG
jgi:hypothetical protein